MSNGQACDPPDDSDDQNSEDEIVATLPPAQPLAAVNLAFVESATTLPLCRFLDLSNLTHGGKEAAASEPSMQLSSSFATAQSRLPSLERVFKCKITLEESGFEGQVIFSVEGLTDSLLKVDKCDLAALLARRFLQRVSEHLPMLRGPEDLVIIIEDFVISLSMHAPIKLIVDLVVWHPLAPKGKDITFSARCLLTVPTTGNAQSMRAQPVATTKDLDLGVADGKHVVRADKARCGYQGKARTGRQVRSRKRNRAGKPQSHQLDRTMQEDELFES